MVIRFVCRQAPAVLAVLVWSAPAWADRQVEQRLEQAESLNITAPVTEGWSVIRKLLTEIDKATPRQQARIRLLAVRNLALQGKVDEAVVMAQPLAEQQDFPDLQLSALRLLANLAMNSGRFDAAFADLNRALRLLERIEAPSEAATVYGLASQFHSEAGDGDRAVEFALRALESARLAGKDRRECLALTRLSIAYQAAARMPEAGDAAHRAMPLCRGSGDPVALGLILLQTSDLSITAGDLDRAEVLLQAALTSYAGTFLIGEIEARLLMARLALARNDPDAVFELVQAILPVAQERNRTDLLELAYAHSAAAAEQLGDPGRALEYTRLQLKANEAQLRRMASLRLAFAQVQFDVRTREQELALLQEQARVNELERRTLQQSERLRGLVVFFGMLALLLLAAWLIRVLRERRHFHRLSEIDGLTGLYNHTRFFSRTEELIGETGTADRPFILVLADIDHFKQVNDQYGHQVGDDALRNTARIISDQFGDGIVVGRIGGEEFAICMPDHSIEQAKARIDALRKRLAANMRRENGPNISMSFGIGILQPGEPAARLRARVDKALYRAKHEGRDRVVVADDPGDASDFSMAGIEA